LRLLLRVRDVDNPRNADVVEVVGVVESEIRPLVGPAAAEGADETDVLDDTSKMPVLSFASDEAEADEGGGIGGVDVVDDASANRVLASVVEGGWRVVIGTTARLVALLSRTVSRRLVGGVVDVALLEPAAAVVFCKASLLHCPVRTAAGNGTRLFHILL